MDREIRKQLEKENVIPTKDMVVYDEIRLIRELSCITALEAMWQILGFDLCCCSHVVTPLAVHEEREENILLAEGQEEEALKRLLEQEEVEVTSAFTAWMKLNQVSDTLFPVILPGERRGQAVHLWRGRQPLLLRRSQEALHASFEEEEPLHGQVPHHGLQRVAQLPGTLRPATSRSQQQKHPELEGHQDSQRRHLQDVHRSSGGKFSHSFHSSLLGSRAVGQ